MELKHIIVHKIIREQNTPASYQEGPKVLDAKGPLVNDLIEGILAAYTRGKSYGSFSDDADSYPVQGWLNEYFESQKKNKDSQKEKDECFVAFTKRLLRRLGSKMADTVFATGGYFVFSEYSTSTQNYFLVAMVKDKKGLMVTPSLEISNITEIDLKNLHQAAQINIDSFAAGYEGYLSFLKTKNQAREVLAYFTEALGCTDVIPSKVSTDQTMKVVNEVCYRANLDHQEMRNIRKEVLGYLEDNIHNIVTLKKIATKINSFLDEQYFELFINLANSDKYRISMEFSPNRTALRKFKKMDIKAGRWSLNFERELLGTNDSNSDIVWDGDVLTFRKIPDKYKAELDIILESN